MIPVRILRHGQAVKYAGVSSFTFRLLAQQGLLGGAPLWPKGKNFYLSSIIDHRLRDLPADQIYGQEPKKELLRCVDVLAWTGLNKMQLLWIRQHTATPFWKDYCATNRFYYPREAVRKALFIPLLPKGWV